MEGLTLVNLHRKACNVAQMWVSLEFSFLKKAFNFLKSSGTKLTPILPALRPEFISYV